MATSFWCVRKRWTTHLPLVHSYLYRAILLTRCTDWFTRGQFTPSMQGQFKPIYPIAVAFDHGTYIFHSRRCMLRVQSLRCFHADNIPLSFSAPSRWYCSRKSNNFIYWNRLEFGNCDRRVLDYCEFVGEYCSCDLFFISVLLFLFC